MGFNEFISKLFGNKATRDMKEIQPWVNKVKAVYPEIAKLSHDELRAKTEELKKRIKDSAVEENKKIEELKAPSSLPNWKSVKLSLHRSINWKRKCLTSMRLCSTKSFPSFCHRERYGPPTL